jgi:hypothetical protein
MNPFIKVLLFIDKNIYMRIFFLSPHGHEISSFFFFLGDKKQLNTMPAKGTKLSSSKKAARALKAAVTRCQNKCSATGGAKAPRKSMSASKKRKAADRLAPWRNFLAQWRVDHPNITKDVMTRASSAYQRAKVAGEV